MIVGGVVVLVLVVWGLKSIPMHWEDFWASAAVYWLLVAGALAATAIIMDLAT